MGELYSYELSEGSEGRSQQASHAFLKVSGMNKQMDEWTHKQMDKWIIVLGNVYLFNCSLACRVKFHSFQKTWNEQNSSNPGPGLEIMLLCSQPDKFFLSRFPYLTPLQISETSVQLCFQRSFRSPGWSNPYREALTALCPHRHSSCHSDNFTTAFLFKQISVPPLDCKLHEGKN